MNSGSGRRYSVEELTAMNRAATTPKQPTTPQQPVPPASHPTEQEWEELLALQQEAARHLEKIAWQLDKYPYPPDLKPSEKRLATLEQELKALRQTAEKLEQAGRKKEPRSCKWLNRVPDFNLTVVVKWVALVLIIVGALLAVVYGVTTILGNIRRLLL